MSRYLFFVSQLYGFAILRPLQALLRSQGHECAWFFETPGHAQHLRADEQQLSRVREVSEWQPAAVFVPGNWVPDVFPGLKVEVFHGFSVGKRSEHRGHFRIRGFFDLYCTQGPDTTAPFLELQRQHGYFRVVETGWPKLDPLFRQPPGVRRHSRPTILLASTFTEDISCARVLHDTIARLAQRPDWQWLVTLHPKMAPDVVRSYQALAGPNLLFCATDDILQLYAQADVLLSDTSSVVPEFLVQHKPVVTFRNRKPGPHLIDVQETARVLPALQQALQPSPELRAAIRSYADAIHPYRDGRSSERVVQATEEALRLGAAGLKRKPWNLWRKWQARQRLKGR
jgi:CDP-glycerol glycerophosphotransferase (TagB/SpsB family)